MALIGNWGNCLDGCPTDNSTDNSTSPWDYAALCDNCTEVIRLLLYYIVLYFKLLGQLDNTTDNSSSPWDFAALCETGQCPAGWNTEEESCSLNMEDLEETAAKERCAKYRGDFSTATQGRYQCKGGPNKRIIMMEII